MSQVSKSTTSNSNISKPNTMSFSTQRQKQNAEWAFATNSRDENGIVLCIPRVFANISKQRVFACMCNTKWGQINHVDLIKCGSYQKAFVHFEPNGWACGSEPEQALRRLQAGEQVVFTYDVNDKHPEGWFWKISISKALNPKFRPKRVKRRNRVDLSAGSDMKVSAKPFVPAQVTDDMLLQRKNSNQQTVRDDPIASRLREHAANVAKCSPKHRVSDEELEGSVIPSQGEGGAPDPYAGIGGRRRRRRRSRKRRRSKRRKSRKSRKRRRSRRRRRRR